MDPISIGRLFSLEIKVLHILFFFSIIILYNLLFSAFRLYRSRRLSSRWNEVSDILKATSLGALSLIILSRLFGIHWINWGVILFFWPFSTIIIVLSRITLRQGLGWIRTRGRNLRYILILGTNKEAIEFAKKIESNPELGYRLIGFIDEDWEGMGNFRKTGYTLIGDFNDFLPVIRDKVVDEVWIRLPFESHSRKISDLVAHCNIFGIVIRFFPNIASPKFTHLKPEKFQGSSVFTQYSGGMVGWHLLSKRLVDISTSLILIIVLSPLFFIAAILIKSTSPGPVFFIQERIGRNKRRFQLYKFRTMINSAEDQMEELEQLNEASGPVFKIKNDPRITSIGKTLRRTSIDELPQLFNVLKGDMSLVGPRPLPVRDYNGFYEDQHRRRFSVTPGMTCLWQIKGRNSIPFEKWMELDLHYIDHWSLWLDLKILVKTIPVVLKGSDAS